MSAAHEYNFAFQMWNVEKKRKPWRILMINPKHLQLERRKILGKSTMKNQKPKNPKPIALRKYIWQQLQ